MKTILLVDDSDSIRHLLGASLRGAGYHVIEACDGLEALARLEHCDVHLVITDLHMPGMDGIELVTAAKALPRHRFTPFIMTSTEDGEAWRSAGQAAGIKMWIPKPSDPRRILQAIAQLIAP